MFLVDPGGKLNESLKFFYEKMNGHETVFIIDDCAANKDTEKKEIFWLNWPLVVGMQRSLCGS